MRRRPPRSTPFPTRRSSDLHGRSHRLPLRPLVEADDRLELRKVHALAVKRKTPCGKVGERSEEHTSELQSRQYLVCRLLLEKNKSRYTTCTVGDSAA